MKLINRGYCRTCQFGLRIGMYFLKYKEPKVVQKEKAILDIPEILKSKQITNVLVVTDKNIVKLGLIEDLLTSLSVNNINNEVYDNIIPNPTINNVEVGVKIYLESHCQAIIAVGGGSPMDCAKMIGARASNPKLTISKMRGQLKVRKAPPLFIAVPTTAGTGSETTLAAVITDSNTSEKFAINDPKLIPDYAILDPNLTVNLPSSVTSTTGMDALTHAVEAYIGRSNTKKTREYAKTAVKLISENLLECYNNPTNLTARMKMLEGSFKAGYSFSRAYVGYVHAVAHSLGGKYHTPHGLANAIILPHFLKAYGSSVYKPLSELADEISLTAKDKSNQEKAEAFIAWIEQLNNSMNIPKFLENTILVEDIPSLAARAAKEANPLYPVPKLFSQEELAQIYTIISKGEK